MEHFKLFLDLKHDISQSIISNNFLLLCCIRMDVLMFTNQDPRRIKHSFFATLNLSSVHLPMSCVP